LKILRIAHGLLVLHVKIKFQCYYVDVSNMKLRRILFNAGFAIGLAEYPVLYLAPITVQERSIILVCLVVASFGFMLWSKFMHVKEPEKENKRLREYILRKARDVAYNSPQS
jgi:hypothetical protein